MLTVYCGPMFAGKTTALIDEYYSNTMLGRTSIFLKPNVDSRYSQTAVISHDGESVPCVNIFSADDISYYGNGYSCVFIDEVQFLEGKEYTKQIRKLLRSGKDIYVAGLDTDSNGKVFRTTAYCLAMATVVRKCTAICECGAPATMTSRRGDWDGRIKLGGSNEYEALCNRCFNQRFKLTT